MFRDVTKLALGEAQATQTTSQPPQTGRKSVFMHCSAGHHAVAIEGYLFAVFSIVDIIVQTILTCLNALQQDGRGYTSVFTTGPLGPCWGRLQCSSDSLAGFCKPSSKGRERRGKGRKRVGEERGDGAERRERSGLSALY